MRFLVTYEDDDGTAIVTPGPADVLAFEEEHSTTLTAAIRSGSPRWSMWLCWHRLHRRGDARDFPTWLDRVVSITDAEADDKGESDPTDGAPEPGEQAPPASSPSSPPEVATAT